MPVSLQRHTQFLVALVLVGLLTSCGLLGVATQSLHLPPVLVHNSVVWIGDLCRTYGDQSGPHVRECPQATPWTCSCMGRRCGIMS